MWSLLILASCTSLIAGQFTIDYEHNTFTMDGKPFQYVAGSMHLFRVPKAYWRDRLRKMREAGLNAVTTYIEWSQHERIPGQYDFSGELDLKEFLETAKEEDLFVILRPGPYICAERDMGGLPYWLLKKNPNIKLRTMDRTYIKYVERWLNVLMPLLQPFLYGNGGPIIMMQVENEYGSYPACDLEYQLWLRDTFRRYVGDKAVLFTTDGGATNFLKCGKIPGVYATVDFGTGANITNAFGAQRRYEPKGPLVNSEFYQGWLTHWGEPVQVVEIDPIIRSLNDMLDMGANINIYMFHGGTNFGFTAGSNLISTYQPDITSYDYDAPLSESGDITPKYKAIQDVLLSRFPKRVSKKPIITSKKGDYGEIRLREVANLLSIPMRQKLGRVSHSIYPETFEHLNQNYGYLLYETKAMSKNRKLPKQLLIPKFSDRALVYVNGEFMGKLSREANTNKLPVIAQTGDTISILVENLGRINYGPYNNDSKGILTNVTLDNELLTGWTMTSFEMGNIDNVTQCLTSEINQCIDGSPIKIFLGSFVIHEPHNSTSEILPDTFINCTSLKKGLVFINGYNLGRYWSTRGPQYSLYVPGTYLNKSPKNNVVIILDENIVNDEISVNFSPTSIWSTNRKIVKPIG